MATVQYKSKENAGRKFWTGRYGRYAIRIDASRPGVFKWLITLEGRSVRKGSPPTVTRLPPLVSDALNELPR
jgi:hypothetical protein